MSILWVKKEQADKQGIYLEEEIDPVSSVQPRGLTALITALLDAAIEIASVCALEKWVYFHVKDTGDGYMLVCGAADGQKQPEPERESRLTDLCKLAEQYGGSMETDVIEDSIQISILIPIQEAGIRTLNNHSVN